MHVTLGFKYVWILNQIRCYIYERIEQVKIHKHHQESIKNGY